MVSASSPPRSAERLDPAGRELISRRYFQLGREFSGPQTAAPSVLTMNVTPHAREDRERQTERISVNGVNEIEKSETVEWARAFITGPRRPSSAPGHVDTGRGTRRILNEKRTERAGSALSIGGHFPSRNESRKPGINKDICRPETYVIAGIKERVQYTAGPQNQSGCSVPLVNGSFVRSINN